LRYKLLSPLSFKTIPPAFLQNAFLPAFFANQRKNDSVNNDGLKFQQHQDLK